jgi:hypothetical protein
MSFLGVIHDKLFGDNSVSGAGRPCMKKAFFYTPAYEEGSEWFFSWRSEDHSQGEIRGPYRSQETTDMMRENWQRTVIGITLPA